MAGETVKTRLPVRKVLLISPTGAFGGAERALVSLAKGIAINAEPTAILLQNGPLEKLLAGVGCRVTVMPAGRTRQLLRTAKMIRRIRQEVRRADVVVANMSKGHVYAGLATVGTGLPEIWWQHGIPSSNRIDAVAGRIPSGAVVCTTKIAARSQRSLTPGARIELIPCGVDLEALTAAAGSGRAIRQTLAWDECLVVGIVGRLQPWKGQKTFLKAAAEVASRNDNVRFCIVGGAVLGWEGEYPEELKALAVDLGIAGICHFAGHQEDVYPWFDAMDVVVNASEAEPFGLVILEAMALGKPVVAASDGGPTEIIDDGADGFLVPVNDPPALAERIHALVENDLLRKEVGTAAQVSVKRFSEHTMVESFSRLFEDLIAERDQT